MWTLKHIKIFPYEHIKAGRFPDSQDITFAFRLFYEQKNLADPTYRVVYYFKGGPGTAATVKLNKLSGSHRDFIVDNDDVYVRLAFRDVGIYGKKSGLKKIIANRLVWSIRLIELSVEARVEMAAQISKAIWVRRTDEN